MSFFQRFTTTLRADAHGLVDALEDQALLLKQHLRDAELAVQRKRAALVHLTTTVKRLSAERERAFTDAARFERDATLALEQGREDLARYALKQLLPRKRLIERIEARLVAMADEQKQLESTLERQNAALEELRARVHTALSDREAGVFEAGFEPVTDEQIELELLRRKTSAGSGVPSGPGTPSGTGERTGSNG